MQRLFKVFFVVWLMIGCNDEAATADDSPATVDAASLIDSRSGDTGGANPTDTGRDGTPAPIDAAAGARDATPSGDAAPLLDAATTDSGAMTSCPPADVDCEGIDVHSRNAPNRYPIVLVHGMGGFDRLGPLEYFYGIPALLRENGYDVQITVADPFTSSEVRARQIAPQLDRILACACRDKVNLVGHSQGGVDIRLLVAGLGYADRVASVTTIASPHRGTAIADAILGLTEAPADLVDMFMDLFTGVIYGPPEEDADVRAALTSCSTPAMTEFNARYPNAEGVAYYSYAGFSGVTADGRPECEDGELPVPERGDLVAPELLPGYLYLGGPRVANDGLLTVESSKWGRFRGCVPADHLDGIGQLLGVVDSFDYRRFYLQMAEFLANEGY